MSSSDSPQAFLLRLSGQLLLSRCVGVVAEWRVADHLAGGPLRASELAALCGADPDALYRVLRLLASHEIFAEQPDGRFTLTPRAECLQADCPGSLRPLFCRAWQNLSWNTLYRLPEALQTGSVAFELAHGAEFFDYLAAHPASGAAFDQAMALVSSAEHPVIAAQFDFGRFARVMDVGGGRGGLLGAILKAHPGVRGILFDQVQVLAAPTDIEAAAVPGRWECRAGDFFDGVPAGADLYVLKRIIHDWDDEAAIRILANCRAALAAGGRLAVIDAVMEPGNTPDPNKATDVSLMVLTKGRERTAAQFESLFQRAGLRIEAIHPLPRPATLSIIETVPS